MANHRLHHGHADKEGDPHRPRGSSTWAAGLVLQLLVKLGLATLYPAPATVPAREGPK